MKNEKLSALLNTPLGLVIVLASLVLTVELSIMLVIHDALIRAMPDVYWEFIDAALLTLIVAPALYFLVFRKRQEDQERLRQTLATAPNAIAIVNGQARITDWNSAAQRMFGYTHEEALGQPMHQLIAPPRYHADAERGFAHFEETGEGPVIGKTTEISAIRKDGSEFPVELSISAIKLEGRWHAIGIMHDITERKAAEAAIERERNRLDVILKTASDGIHILDAECLLVDANDAFLDMLGLDRTAIGHLHGFDWDVQLGDETIREEIKKLIAGHGASFHETRQRRSDGRIIDVEVSTRGFEFDGQGYICASSRDISERKQAETRLAEQLEELRRWHEITSGREERILSIKHEVNELLGKSGLPPRYPSAEP